MRDLSLFLIKKNSVGAKMKKGLRNFCNDDGSTSTLNQHHKTTCTLVPAADQYQYHHHHHHHHRHPTADSSSNNASVPVVHSPTDYNYYLQQNNNLSSSNYSNNSDHDHHQKTPPPTLEEMILRLDLEEEMARSKYSKLNCKGRMSCVNNSDILRSARNALNQYPRFSLDGKDAMYRSSFRNSLDIIHNDMRITEKPAAGGRKSVRSSNFDFAGRLRSAGKLVWDDERDDREFGHDDPNMFTTTLRCGLPETLAGESVVWRKPGVVAKLMGLEAMPVVLVPASVMGTSSKSDKKLDCIDVMDIKRQNLIIRRRNYIDINDSGKKQCDHRFINKEAAAGKRITVASSSCTTSVDSKTTSAGAARNNNYCFIKPGVANRPGLAVQST